MLNDNPAQVVLYGNLAADDSSVETAGIAESMFAVEELRYTSRVPTPTLRVFTGHARLLAQRLRFMAGLANCPSPLR